MNDEDMKESIGNFDDMNLLIITWWWHGWIYWYVSIGMYILVCIYWYVSIGMYILVCIYWYVSIGMYLLKLTEVMLTNIGTWWCEGDHSSKLFCVFLYLLVDGINLSIIT